MCNHPDHNNSETCEDRAVSCSADCACCNGREFVDSREGFSEQEEEAHAEGYPCAYCGNLCDEEFCSEECENDHYLSWR